jgi:predicted transcriptional regulator
MENAAPPREGLYDKIMDMKRLGHSAGQIALAIKRPLPHVERLLSGCHRITRTWTNFEKEVLEELYHRGLSVEELASRLGRTKTSIEAMCDTLYLRKTIEKPRARSKKPSAMRSRERHLRNRLNNEPAVLFPPDTDEDGRLHLLYANQLHLLELKRAGHSPAKTELSIPPGDGIPLRLTPTDNTRSAIGSHFGHLPSSRPHS